MQSFTKIMSETLNIIVRMSIYHTNYALLVTYADLNPETELPNVVGISFLS